MKISSHKMFAIVAFLFGIVFVMIVPPFQSPDESTHFKKAYVIAKGEFFPNVVSEDGKSIGYNIPKAINDYYKESIKKVSDLDAKYTYKDLYFSDKLTQYYDEEVFDSLVVGSPINHIIPAIGIDIGKLVSLCTVGGGASFINLLYYGRLFNLLFYIAVVTVSIKMTPILKKTMSAIALMPMSLYMAASVSYDVLLMSCMFFAFAYIFKLMTEKDKKLCVKDIIILAIVGLLIACIKINYIFIFILLFFLPKEKFDNKKDFTIKASIFAAIILFGYIVNNLSLSFFSVAPTKIVETAKSSLINQQITMFLTNPLLFFNALFNSLNGYKEYYLTTFVGVFGNLDTNLLSAFVYLFLPVLICLGIFEISKTEIKFNGLVKLSSLFAFVIPMIFAYLGMYLFWTPTVVDEIGGNIVSGIQGRYFIPVILFLFVAFNNNLIYKIKGKTKNAILIFVNNYLEYFVYISIGMLIVSVFSIMLRFWV